MDKYSEEILDRFSDLLDFDSFSSPEKIRCRMIKKSLYSTPYGKFLKGIYRIKVLDKSYKTLAKFEISVLIK